MRTSTGWLQSWTVANDPSDDGADKRVINIKLAVIANSTIAMSVAALFGRQALLGLALPVGGGPVLHSVPCMLLPPWGARKKGDFRFTAQVAFDDNLVNTLASLTHGVPLDIALDNAAHELDLDAEQRDVLAFVAGGE